MRINAGCLYNFSDIIKIMAHSQVNVGMRSLPVDMTTFLPRCLYRERFVGYFVVLLFFFLLLETLASDFGGLQLINGSTLTEADHRTLIRNHTFTFRIDRYHRCASPTTESARNCVSVPRNFDSRLRGYCRHSGLARIPRNTHREAVTSA